MSRTEPTPDTSMEDILASIRRIIADEPEPAAPAFPSVRNGDFSTLSRPEPAFADDIARALNDPADDAVLDTSDDDILDLGGTAKAAAPASRAEPIIAAAPVEAVAKSTLADDGNIDEAPLALETPLDPPLPTGPVVVVVGSEPEAATTGTPVAAATTAATIDPPLPAAATTVPRSLEDMVAEMLRPMLRDWLDDNMPRLVAKAIATGAAKPAAGSTAAV